MINWIHALIRYETRARIDGQEPSIVEVTAHREPPLALVDREDEQRLVSVARDTLSRYHAPPTSMMAYPIASMSLLCTATAPCPTST